MTDKVEFTGRRDPDPAFDQALDASRIDMEATHGRNLIVGVYLNKDGTGGVGRAVSQGFTRSEAFALATALEHEANRIRAQALNAPAV